MRFKKPHISIFSIVFLIIIFSVLQGYRMILKPNFLIGQSSKPLFISAGTSFAKLQDQLTQGRYISNPVTFKWLARLLHYDKKILPGAYRLQPGMNNWQAIKLLRAGMQEPVKIVLHTASTQKELAEKLTQNIEINAASFQQLLNDAQFIQPYGFTTDNILTMFIPNTYYVYWTISPQELFKRLYKEYQQFWNKERLTKAQQLGLSTQQVSILASIIEKETNQPTEAPIIAGVYINRLKKGMKLQSCPTILYIVNDPSIKRVLHAHTRIDSPYNTYLYKGLPPGPITIPSIAAIDAVLNYQQHHYLYFVIKEDLPGFHYFSKTFQEHKKNAAKYRRILRLASK
jgi:UPF0755 protein